MTTKSLPTSLVPPLEPTTTAGGDRGRNYVGAWERVRASWPWASLEVNFDFRHPSCRKRDQLYKEQDPRIDTWYATIHGRRLYFCHRYAMQTKLNSMTF